MMKKYFNHLAKRLSPARSQGGFTLIEIIVSLMIFSIVVLVALSALVKIIDANKKAQTIQDSVINLSFTLESMSREMRSGSYYNCQEGIAATIGTLSSSNISAQCVNGLSASNTTNGVLFAFASAKTAPNGSGGTCRLSIAYRIRPSGAGDWYLEKAEQTACGTPIVSYTSGVGDSFSPIVSTSSVSVTGFYLKMTGNYFPLAFIQLSGNAGSRELTRSYFVVQTADSPRVP